MATATTRRFALTKYIVVLLAALAVALMMSHDAQAKPAKERAVTTKAVWQRPGCRSWLARIVIHNTKSAPATVVNNIAPPDVTTLPGMPGELAAHETFSTLQVLDSSQPAYAFVVTLSWADPVVRHYVVAVKRPTADCARPSPRPSPNASSTVAGGGGPQVRTVTATPEPQPTVTVTHEVSSSEVSGPHLLGSWFLLLIMAVLFILVLRFVFSFLLLIILVVIWAVLFLLVVNAITSSALVFFVMFLVALIACIFGVAWWLTSRRGEHRPT